MIQGGYLGGCFSAVYHGMPADILSPQPVKQDYFAFLGRISPEKGIEAAIRIGAKGVWMQEEVVHPEAAARASSAGLKVVMDRCIYRDYKNEYSQMRAPALKR